MNGTSGTLLHAVRGPVLLITLGVLLVVDHMGIYGFWRLSPVLLIVLGLFMLLERVVLRAPSGPKEGPQT